MKKLSLVCMLLVSASLVHAAPNVTSVTQKGSLLLFPDVRVDAEAADPLRLWNTLIRMQNDGTIDVNVKCYWMDGNKNRVDFGFSITRGQAFWFDARTGNGTFGVNPFPLVPANGIDNPHLITPPATTEAADGSGPYRKGLLACWAVDAGHQNQVKWNHLSGTATLYHPFLGAYEYNAFAFAVPTGIDLEPVGVPGTLNLNGVEYDSCPQYQMAQFTPAGPYNNPAPNPAFPPAAVPVQAVRLAIAGCTLDLRQDYVPVYTKLDFEVWNEDEIKYTGAFECADSWHETEFNTNPTANAGGGIDSAAQNFQWATLQTYSARYRVRGVASTQCTASQAVGVVGVQVQYRDLGLAAVGAIYSAIPAVIPPNVSSLGFQATQTDEFGDHVAFTPGSSRTLGSATVLMSSWACETGAWQNANCITTPGATFTHPITLNIYAVNPGPSVGALIATRTIVATIPYRPTADPTCPNGGTAWRAGDGNCYNGFAFPLTFDLTGVTVPNEVIWGVAFNTTTWGANPIGAAPCGANCPYDSLNVGASTLALIGTDVDTDGAFWDTHTAANYCDGGAAGVNVFRLDTDPTAALCWEGFRPMISFVPEPSSKAFGTTLTASGRFTGRILWDASGPTPEGGIK